MLIKVTNLSDQFFPNGISCEKVIYSLTVDTLYIIAKNGNVIKSFY